MVKLRRLPLLLGLLFAVLAAACSGDAADDATEGAATEEAATEEAATEEAATEEAATAEAMTEEETATAEAMTEEETATEEEAASNEDVPGVTEDTIRFGATLPITGPAQLAGEGLVAGIQIAVDEANAGGGIDGRMIEFVPLDDGFDPARTVSNMRRLIEEEQVYAVSSPAGSQGLPGAWDFVDQAGTIVWGPVSPADPDLQSVYILGPSRGEQLHICTDYAAELGHTQIGVIGQDNELGAAGLAGVEAAVAANPDLTLVGNERVEVLSQEVASAVLNLRDAGAEAIMLATDNVQAGLIMLETDQLGYDVFLCADNGGGGTGGQNSVGPAGAAADGFVGALQQDLPTNTENPAVADWAALAEAYDGQGADQKMSNFSLQTYYYTRALIEVIDGLEGDLAYENFHAAAEALADTPIELGAIPAVGCGPLPGGHSCGSGAALAEYDFDTMTWSVVREFQAASGEE